MKIAIVAGSGNFPIQIAKENPDAFVLCIEDHVFNKILNLNIYKCFTMFHFIRKTSF